MHELFFCQLCDPKTVAGRVQSYPAAPRQVLQVCIQAGYNASGDASKKVSKELVYACDAINQSRIM